MRGKRYKLSISVCKHDSYEKKVFINDCIIEFSHLLRYTIARNTFSINTDAI